MSDFLSENNALHLLHATVKNYEKDVTSFYLANDQATSKFTGRFDFKTFAKKCFDPIDSKELGELYVRMLIESQSYMHMHQKSRIGAAGFPHSFVSVPELLLNMILAYQLPQQKFVPFEKKEEREEKPEEETSGAGAVGGGSRKKRRSSAAGKKGKNVTINPRVVLHNELAAKLLEEMLKIPLAPESKVWKQAKYVLCPSNCPKQMTVFGRIIAKNTDSGFISFNALNFFMHDQTLNRYLENPATILHALYIGPLSAQTIEVFAANRSDAFRGKCREVLRMAIEATRDPMKFQALEPDYIAPNHPDHVKFRDFVETVTQLIRDLNGENNANTGLHAGWACAAIKKFGHKRYVDKTWKDENFYDLIWTVLAQRPNLKKFVIDVLEKNFKDYNAARFWRRMQPYQMNRTIIFNQNVIREDPLKPTDEFLNFPPCVRQISVISNEKELRDLQMLLEYKASREDRLCVGVDAEWSAYVNPSKATILQMALTDIVYILDLESAQISQNTYMLFLSYLFETPEIIKIGFQFGEDLHQLRAAFRNCSSLYKPNSVVCVGKLIMDLMDEIGKQDNSEEIKKEWLPFLTDEEKGGKESADSSIDETADKSMSNESMEVMESEAVATSSSSEVAKPAKEENVKQFLNKGLSFICEKVLGRPLDKTEQCSVWDRRPLRNLQMRYAAMDAYCMLMLYDKSKPIFQHIGLDAKDFLAKQSPIRISLPLLSEGKL
ncbi:unnamed protein product [Caenorhabditis sp. 36 PRJEB53466]|nr:unnamed protein product [Caenorhabditis sp. 36 PRJEB53466]